MFFVGIDLAWSERNTSAISIIKANGNRGVLINWISKIKTNEEILNWVLERIKNEPAVISIDAPLIVKNLKGRREADALVTKLFRKYHAGAHPTNIERLEKFGGLRGESLTKLFEEKGYSNNPYFKPKSEVRAVIEVFPHPAIVVFFNLKKTLKYKAKKGRKQDFLLAEFRKYQKDIKTLESKEPALKLPKEIFVDISKLKRKELKEYEDLLDSIICAYIGFYYWYWGTRKNAVLGSLKKGYIVTPIFDWMKKVLSQKQSKLKEFI